jgi:Ca2+-binding RTX toxin-like protein
VVSETVSATNLSDAGGRDRVDSAISLNLGANAGLRFIEELVLTGTGNTSATGNGLANLINGNAGANYIRGAGGNDLLSGGNGADLLSGGAGRDRLTGGNGADSFVFDTRPVVGQADVISDFRVPFDTIRLDDAAFAGLGLGPLAASAFVRNLTGSAADASDRIIYETDTGRLWFDADGTGSRAAIHFATVTVSLSMTNADFLVI